MGTSIRRAGAPSNATVNGSATRAGRGDATTRAALFLWALEAGALLALIALHKRGERGLQQYFGAAAGKFLALALVVIAAFTLLVAREFIHPESRRKAVAGLLLNLWSVLLVFITAETSLRVLTTKTAAGPRFGHMQLLPMSWQSVATHGRAVLARAAREGSYLVFDADLGWVVARGRQSRDYTLDIADQAGRDAARRAGNDGIGVYNSSVEGLRSGRAGESLASAPHGRRIALVGDSFTFGLEVRFEDTWGDQLQRAIGHDVQVLNFGVDGYGVDQAYLRYTRDVVSWHPDIVVFGVITDDLRRSLCVYSFLCFGGFEDPFPKPRFVVANDSLQLINTPLPTPASLFEHRRIDQLPFVDFDGSYDPTEWTPRTPHTPYATRLLLTHFRSWPAPNPAVSDSALTRLNTELFKAFIRRARANGSIPLIVPFPSHTELARGDVGPSRVEQLLRAANIEYIDVGGCVRGVARSVRLVRTHYSRRTNAAVARCLDDALEARHLLP